MRGTGLCLLQHATQKDDFEDEDEEEYEDD